jgi:AraC family transcriptional regulator
MLPAPQLSSAHSWNGIRLEQRRGDSGEIQEGYMLGHIVAVHSSAPMTFDVYWPGRGWKLERLSTGAAAVIPARMPFASRWTGSGENVIVELAPELIAGMTGRDAADARVEVRPSIGIEDPFLTRTVFALEDDLRAGSPGGRIYGETLGAALAAHVVRKHSAVSPETPRGGLPGPTLRHVLDYICENLRRDLSLNELAALARMDVYRFGRLFKHSTGLPPHRFIVLKRIDLAKRLLAIQALPMTEVALRSGFANQSHFTTVFRRIANLTPGAFRAAVT